MFFFSSRRRHTRWNCDWSSDVCSSDLAVTRPSNLVVVENIIRQETKGFEQPIDARFDMLEGGQYTIDVPAAQLPSAKAAPKHPWTCSKPATLLPFLRPLGRTVMRPIAWPKLPTCSHARKTTFAANRAELQLALRLVAPRKWPKTLGS